MFMYEKYKVKYIFNEEEKTIKTRAPFNWSYYPKTAFIQLLQLVQSVSKLILPSHIGVNGWLSCSKCRKTLNTIPSLKWGWLFCSKWDKNPIHLKWGCLFCSQDGTIPSPYPPSNEVGYFAQNVIKTLSYLKWGWLVCLKWDKKPILPPMRLVILFKMW